MIGPRVAPGGEPYYCYYYYDYHNYNYNYYYYYDYGRISNSMWI